MPAYIQHHEDELAAIICPNRIGRFAMYVSSAAPDWSMLKVELTYECSECGTELKRTITKH